MGTPRTNQANICLHVYPGEETCFNSFLMDMLVKTVSCLVEDIYVLEALMNVMVKGTHI